MLGAVFVSDDVRPRPALTDSPSTRCLLLPSFCVVFTAPTHFAFTLTSARSPKRHRQREKTFFYYNIPQEKKKCRLAELLDLNVVFFPAGLFTSVWAGRCRNWWKSLWSQRKHEKARQSKDRIYLQSVKRTDEYRGGERRRFHPDSPSPWLPVKESGIAALNETPLPHLKWPQRPNHGNRPLTTYATRLFRVC